MLCPSKQRFVCRNERDRNRRAPAGERGRDQKQQHEGSRRHRLFPATEIPPSKPTIGIGYVSAGSLQNTQMSSIEISVCCSLKQPPIGSPAPIPWPISIG